MSEARSEQKLYIYSSAGIYQNHFDLMMDRYIPQSITTYNNQFYVSSSDRDGEDKVYIYSSTGEYQSNFEFTW